MTIETWSETVGTAPHRVTVFEHVGKSLAVYLRWYVDRKPKHARTRVGTVRDARGRVTAKKVKEARAEAVAKAIELAGGTPAKKPHGPMTLGEGIALAFSDRGPYPLDPAQHAHTKVAKQYAALAAEILGGPDVLWEEVTPGMVRSIWRTLQRQYSDGGGYKKAEKVVVILFRIAGWLMGEFPEQRFPSPMKGWRKELREHWSSKGHRITPHQPRHEEHEVRALFAHLHEADPRLALALVLGAELRGGQVIRTMRSNVDLSEDAGIGYGKVQIPFTSERKRAPLVSLNKTERTALDAAMEKGYLSELEGAYKVGLVKDYALFPGGKLRNGVVPVERGAKPMHATSLADFLHDVEKKAGVETIKGRGWHGLRRAFTDLYPTATTDARLLDHLGGWVQGSTMREGTYQDKQNETIAARAAEMRERVRPGTRPTEDEG